ncbi:MAG: aminoacyl-tRNA hydrolase [Candidatus Omnitrophota bacterium]
MKVIVGLGNPGLKYKNNRHNAGFMVLDEIARYEKVLFKKSFLWNCYFVKIAAGQEAVLLVKPLTYMNNSGRAVKKIIAKYALQPKDLLVVYDDADLPLGALRLKTRGSSGGHQGLTSIITQLDSEEIPRLKLGIDKNIGADLAEHVLSDFSGQEKETISESIAKAASACIDWVKRGSEYVMQNYNK